MKGNGKLLVAIGELSKKKVARVCKRGERCHGGGLIKLCKEEIRDPEGNSDVKVGMVRGRWRQGYTLGAHRSRVECATQRAKSAVRNEKRTEKESKISRMKEIHVRVPKRCEVPR